MTYLDRITFLENALNNEPFLASFSVISCRFLLSVVAGFEITIIRMWAKYLTNMPDTATVDGRNKSN